MFRSSVKAAFASAEEKFFFQLSELLGNSQAGKNRLSEVESTIGSSDEGMESIRRMTGVTIPKRQAEKIALSASGDFHGFYEQKEYNTRMRDDYPMLILTTDGKGIGNEKGFTQKGDKKKGGDESDWYQKKTVSLPGQIAVSEDKVRTLPSFVCGHGRSDCRSLPP